MPSASSSRLRRSVHFVPGGQDKFLDKCLNLGADTLVLDLEDSVFDKAAGREKVRQWLEKNMIGSQSESGRPKSEILVRINPLDSGIWGQDLEACIRADGFMLPKINSKQDVEKISDKIDQILKKDNDSDGNQTSKVLIPIATETPQGVLNLQSIAQSSPKVVAITWGCEDLSAELGSTGNRNPKTNEYLDIFKQVRTMCLLAAKASNVQAIDGVYANIKDEQGCLNESQEARQSGWDGKLSLHPKQIEIIHKGFRPSETEIQESREIVKLFHEEESKDSGGSNKGALLYKGKMIDKPHYVRAKKILASVSEESETALSDSTDSKPSTVVPFKRVFHGKYLDEMSVGDIIPHALTRTVTEADNVLFTCLSMNPAPIHLDHELSKQSVEFGGKPLFNSMFTLALAVGMSVLETTHGTTIANLGFSEVKFPKPVFPGDTLRVETEIVDKRESKSRPNQGIVTLKHVMYNQKGEVVCVAVRQALMKKERPAAKL